MLILQFFGHLWCSVVALKVPKSSFYCKMIFNFDHFYFYGIFCFYFRTCLSHWVSLTWFLCCIESVQQTNFNKMIQNAKMQMQKKLSKLKITVLRKFHWKKNKMKSFKLSLFCQKEYFSFSFEIEGDWSLTKALPSTLIQNSGVVPRRIGLKCYKNMYKKKKIKLC